MNDKLVPLVVCVIIAIAAAEVVGNSAISQWGIWPLLGVKALAGSVAAIAAWVAWHQIYKPKQ